MQGSRHFFHAVSPLLAAVTMTCALIVPPAFGQDAVDPADAPATIPATDADDTLATTDVPDLAARLNDAASTQDARDQAARRLASRGVPDARAALRAALGNLQQPAARLAAARGLAESPAPDPEAAAGLFALLDPQSPAPLLDAAGAALAQYKADEQVLTRLNALGRQAPSEAIRLIALRTLGTFYDKRAAETLVNALDDPSPAVATAAGDALAYLTSIPNFGNDAARWKQWWQENAAADEAAFRARLLAARAARYDQMRQATSALADELQRLLVEQYRLAPPEQQPELLLRYLRSQQPTLRVAGARLAFEIALNLPTPEPVREQLRQLIGDSDVEVRRRSALALSLINDPAALGPLLTQLAQENDSSVKAAIAKALKPIANPQFRAVPALLKLLDDSSLATVKEAVDALREIARRDMTEAVRDRNPDGIAARSAEKLAATLANRTSPTAATDLRESLVSALAQLRQPSVVPLLQRMVYARPPEAPRVRRALATALGSMGDPKLANTIVAMFDDPDSDVVRDAVRSLGAQGAVDSFEYAEKLYRLLGNSGRPPEVQDEAWKVLSSLLPKAPPNQLPMWVERFKDDPRRRIIVLLQLRDRAQAANNPNELAARRQQIGDAYHDLKDDDSAVSFYRDALAHYESVNDSLKADTLSQNLLDSLLLARQYPEAIAFTARKLKENRANQGTLGPKLRDAADRLYVAGELDDAQKLIDEALKMQPALEQRFTYPLQQLKVTIDKKRSEQNLFDPTFDEPQNAMALPGARVATAR